MYSDISQDDYRRVKEILASALEISSAAERANFLQTACAGSENVLAEVKSLLAAGEQAGAFLEDFSPARIVQESMEQSNHLVGQKIGKYHLIGEIGRGGMGVVYLATREDFEQQSAIKLIKRGMDSDAILERFTRERKILAALNHPYIAHLTDGGTTDDNLPFFVMEYVEGAAVDEFCKKNNLSEREILELFRKICEAVQFAHQKLVVHRDLKPSNILVTAGGTPKLLDFGIAKLINSSESSETQTNQRVLTPAYASPEQIRGEAVDTTGDVYSLGKILAELLQISDHQTNAKATNQNKSRTTNNPNLSLSTDLQAVLQTALREESARRYSSVEKFADDIRRYQNGLPVAARKDTFSYRAVKFVQRNYISVSLAAVILLVSIVGLMFILREHNKAERRFNDVRFLANSFLFEFHDAIHDLPGATPARKLVVQRALEYLDKLDQESSGDASLQRELAAAYEKVGQIQGNSYYSNLGDTDGAMKSYARSLELRQKLAAADPNNIKLQKELSDSYDGIGDMFYIIGDLNSGLQNYQNSLSIREKITAVQPDNLEYQVALGDIYSKVGDIKGMEGLPNLGDTFGSLENYQKSVTIDRNLIQLAPENIEFKDNYAQKLSRLGNLYRITGKTADSITTLRNADEIFQTVIAADPNKFSGKFSRLVNNAFLRYSLVDDAQYDEAVELMRQTIKMLEDMQTADPQNAIVRRSLGVSFNALSRTLIQKGDYNQAIENSNRALKIAEDLAGKDSASVENSEDLADTLQFLAEAEFQKKDYKAALLNYHRAIEIHQKNLINSSANTRIRTNLALCQTGTGSVEAAQGNFNEAINNFQQAIPVIETAAQKSPVNVNLQSRLALNYMEYGKVYDEFSKSASEKRQENQAEAKKWFQKSFEIWSQMQNAGILNKSDAKQLQNVIQLLNE